MAMSRSSGLTPDPNQAPARHFALTILPRAEFHASDQRRAAALLFHPARSHRIQVFGFRHGSDGASASKRQFTFDVERTVTNCAA
jgi:hypothetical protein